MRLHKHVISDSNGNGARVSRGDRWHSVRIHHAEVWSWCAHHEEVERYLHERRRLSLMRRAGRVLRFQAAH